MKYQSNALWPSGLYGSMYGDDISTDVHDSKEQAEAICFGLERHGFAGERKYFPIKTWVSEVQSPPVIPNDD